MHNELRMAGSVGRIQNLSRGQVGFGRDLVEEIQDISIRDKDIEMVML